MRERESEAKEWIMSTIKRRVIIGEPYELDARSVETKRRFYERFKRVTPN